MTEFPHFGLPVGEAWGVHRSDQGRRSAPWGAP